MFAAWAVNRPRREHVNYPPNAHGEPYQLSKAILCLFAPFLKNKSP